MMIFRIKIWPKEAPLELKIPPPPPLKEFKGGLGPTWAQKVCRSLIVAYFMMYHLTMTAYAKIIFVVYKI